jgi:hypothetical protein
MKAEFSEYSYSFALSHELVNALRPDLAIVPLFPSLAIAAGPAGEVSFAPEGCPLFIQFKLADYLERPYANYWSLYDAPFFRVTVPERRFSNQHNLLRALSKLEPEIYYAAPAFHRQGTFNEFFAAGRILEESVLLPLRALPEVAEDRPHHITYRKGEPGFHWHGAVDHHIPHPPAGAAWRAHLQERVADARELGRDYYLWLRETLFRLAESYTLQPRLFHATAAPAGEVPVDLGGGSAQDVMRDLRYLLIAYFGIEAFVLRPGASKEPAQRV